MEDRSSLGMKDTSQSIHTMSAIFSIVGFTACVLIVEHAPRHLLLSDEMVSYHLQDHNMRHCIDVAMRCVIGVMVALSALTLAIPVARTRSLGKVENAAQGSTCHEKYNRVRYAVGITFLACSTVFLFFRTLLGGGSIPVMYLVMFPLLSPAPGPLTKKYHVLSGIGLFAILSVIQVVVVLYTRPFLLRLCQIFGPSFTVGTVNVQMLAKSLFIMSTGKQILYILEAMLVFIYISVKASLWNRVRTELNAAQNTLRYQFTLMRVLLEEMPCSVSLCDRDLNILARSGMVQGKHPKLRTYQDLNVKDFGALNINVNHEEIVDNLVQAFEKGESRRFMWKQYADGNKNPDEISYITTHARSFEDPGTGEQRVVIAGIESTEHRKAVHDLELSEKRYHALVDSIDDNIVVVDRDHIVQLSNKEHRSREKESIIGKSLEDTIYCSSEHTKKCLEKVFRTGTPSRFEYNWDMTTMKFVLEDSYDPDVVKEMMLNGTMRHYSVVISPVFDSQNGDTSVEEAFLSFHDSTETRVAEVHELIAEEMRVVSKSKSEFIAQLSHEIRNPLMAISGSLELTSAVVNERTATGEGHEITYCELKEYVEDARRNLSVLLDVLSDVLDSQRLEKGMVSLVETGHNVIDIVESAVDMYSSVATEKKIELMSFIDPSILHKETWQYIRVDRTRVTQVLTNLIGNAIKFTAHGHVCLSLKMYRHEADSDTATLCFECEDTGTGIGKEDRDNLFHQFSQVLSDYQPQQYRGFGLGLSIVSRLVILMGGTVSLAWSEIGKGSRFRVVLPVRLAQPTPSDRTSSEMKAMSLARGEFRQVFRETNAVIVRNSGTATGKLVADISEKYLGALELSSVHQVDQMTPLSIGCSTQFRDFLETLLQCVESLENAVILIDQSLLVDRYTLLAIANFVGNKLPSVKGITALVYRDSRHMIEVANRSSKITYITKPIRFAKFVTTLLYIQIPEECRMRNIAKSPVQEPNTFSLDNQKLLLDMKVLIAEDSPVNQKIMVRFLQRIGCKDVIAVDNGEDAIREYLECSEHGSIDLILMDLQMPKKTGGEATEAIRNAENGLETKVPIVAVTANSDVTTIAYCKEMGFDELLVKPCSQEMIQQTVLKYAARRSTQ